jgi:aminoglycoside phosphotransferase family enzyme
MRTIVPMPGQQLLDSEQARSRPKLIRLRDPATYPDRPALVIPVETTLSWVFLTDRFAYKLKKPICHSRVDLSTLAARHANAKAELELNRRLAPGIYLGIAALTEDSSGRLELDGRGRILDWLVKMRRLPDRLMLDSLLERRALPQVRLGALADRLARFYLEAPRVELRGPTYRQRLLTELRINQDILTDLRPTFPRDRIENLHTRMLGFLENQASLLDARAEGGCLVEGHGDLRCEHVCLLKHPILFDCLEFKERLRQVDPLDDLAFLAVDCERFGCRRVGQALYDCYRSLSGDSPPRRLTEFYSSFRAGLRARLAAAHIPGLSPRIRRRWSDRAVAFLQIAERHASQLG